MLDIDTRYWYGFGKLMKETELAASDVYYGSPAAGLIVKKSGSAAGLIMKKESGWVSRNEAIFRV
jgi:hypothetical protein